MFKKPNLEDWKLTEKGKERTYSIKGEIALVTRVSPKEELRKKNHNIETFIISIFLFTLSDALELLNSSIIWAYYESG